MKRSSALVAALPLSLALALSACGGQSTGKAEGTTVSGEVVADGSSTVAPLTSAAGELFKAEQSGVNVSVGTSGTGGGFEKFCQGQTDLSDASRPIKDEEKAACEKAGVTFTELNVALDALTVVTSTKNTFLTCLTTDELKKLWEPAAEKKITTWNQVNAKFPAEKIQLFGPGTDSGTFDYFTDEINGEEGATRTDYTASEDDNTLVAGVAGSPAALGYFGYTYFEGNTDKLKPIAIDSGKGGVTPSAETAADGTYAPLSRPLFVYVSNKSYADKPQVKAFVDWYVANNADVAKQAQFIKLSDEQNTKLKSDLDTLAKA